MWVAEPRSRPVVGLQMGPTITLQEPILARRYDLSLRTLAASVQLDTSPLGRVIDKVLEAGALRRLGGGVVGKVLAHGTGPWRLLLVALPCRVVVVDLPLGLAVAAGTSGVGIKVEQFA